MKVDPTSTISIEDSDEAILSLIAHERTRNLGYQRLVSAYKERIYWTVRKMINNHEDTNDLVQEIFIKIYKNIDKFNKDAQLYTWIYRIAVNETLAAMRKSKKMKIVSIDSDMTKELNSQVDDHSQLSGAEIEDILNEAITLLPEKQKIVFNLRYFQEMKYQEMSQVLDTSEGGLKALYHHAVKKIEAYVKKHE